MASDGDRSDRVWQDAGVVRSFLSGTRAAIPFAAEQIALLLDVAAAIGRTPVGRVLDLGSGDGILAAAVLDRYPAAEATLVDFSPPMLDAARSRFAGAGDRVAIVEADLAHSAWVSQLPHSDPGAYDLVVSGFAIHHLADEAKRRVFGEIADRLASGGCFLNLDHVASVSPRLSDLFDERLIDALHAGRRRTESDVSRATVGAEYRTRQEVNILVPVETQCAWLREVGFAEVDCYFKWLELALFGGRLSTGEGGD